MSHPSCPRCAGLVVTQYGETRCLLCGWRPCEPEEVASILGPMRDWGPDRCLDCGEPALRRKKYCAQHHGLRIKHGMEEARGR